MMDTVDRTKVSDMQPQQQPTSTSKQIVHVRGDSETELDLLFSVLNSRDQKPPNRSFRDMNLPPSFFRPPEPKPAGYHSRENSLDGVNVVNHLGPTVGVRQPNVNVFHSRSHSSPAQLPLSLSVAPIAGAGHLKQGSADSSGAVANPGAVLVGGIGTEDITANRQQHPVWTGPPQQLINNNKYIANSPAGVWQANPHGVTSNSGVSVAISSANKPLTPNSPLVLAAAGQNLGPLPAGWEQGVTADGDIYYINHNDKSTSWYDPRIPRTAQKVVPVKASSLHATHGAHHGAAARLPGTQILSNAVVVPNANEQLIRIELQKLQKEKDRLLREQEDNNRREQALLKELVKLKSLGVLPASPVASQPSSVHHMVTTGVDPFLGQTAFVGSVSDKAMHESNTQPSNLENHKSSLSTVGNEGSHITAMEMPLLGVDSTEPLAMDSDDLVSSLAGDLGMDVQMMESIIQYI